MPSVVLIATASKVTKKDIFTTLNLGQSTFVIERSPERQNIRFDTHNLPVSITFGSIIEELRNEKGN